jgi:hypothetical protein
MVWSCEIDTAARYSAGVQWSITMRSVLNEQIYSVLYNKLTCIIRYLSLEALAMLEVSA